MVQEEAKLMLSHLTEEKAFNEFYKKGYCSYSNNKDYNGKVAIVSKSIIFYIEDLTDKSKVVATISFQDSGTFVYKLFGKNYSFSQFGQDPTISSHTARVHLRKKDEIVGDIDTIRKYCDNAEEKALAISKASSIVSKFSSILVQSDNKVSSENALLLLNNTLHGLNQSRHLSESEQTTDLNR